VTIQDLLAKHGKHFRVIYADPPWSFADQGTRASPAYSGEQRKRSHYEIMTIDEIAAMPITDLALDDSVLFLWRVAAMQEEALRVCREWGFVPTAEVVWNKITELGTPKIGFGHYVRNAHEVCLIGVRGSMAKRKKVANEPSWFRASPTEHSAKPEAMRRKIERLYDGPYLELFARVRRSGWVSWGDGVRP